MTTLQTCIVHLVYWPNRLTRRNRCAIKTNLYIICAVNSNTVLSLTKHCYVVVVVRIIHLSIGAPSTASDLDRGRCCLKHKITKIKVYMGHLRSDVPLSFDTFYEKCSTAVNTVTESPCDAFNFSTNTRTQVTRL